MSRSLRLVTALVLALVVLAPSGSGSAVPAPDAGRAEVSWKTLPYLSYDSNGQYFYVPTTRQEWKATYVRNVSRGFTFQTQTAETLANNNLEALWGSGCPGKKASTVTLTRKVYLPGRPSQLMIGLQTATGGQTNPLESVALKINGRVVAKIGRTASGAWKTVNATKDADAVVFGLNTLQIVAKKSAVKKPKDYCVNGHFDVGVAAEIYGRPGVDLAATIPPFTGSGVTIDTTATVTNKGPGTLVGAGTGDYFSIGSQDSSSGRITELTVTGPGACQTTDSSSSITAHCDLPKLGPGAGATYSIHLVFTPTACPVNIPVGYGAFGYWSDPQQANNGETRPITVPC